MRSGFEWQRFGLVVEGAELYRIACRQKCRRLAGRLAILHKTLLF